MKQKMDLSSGATAIFSRLKEAGFKAFVVGGAVRDTLMGLPPKDCDIATNARPDQVRRLFRKCILVGEQFGVIRVRAGNPEIEIEVATFRSDGDYLDGRRPTSVSFCDEKEDVLRRDFTINGLLYDPATGEVIDYVGGQEDIAGSLIRAIGEPEKRFGEDRLRLLRAVRFAARTGFAIEDRTLAAIKTLAPAIKEVSAERIRDELLKILATPRRTLGIRLLDETNLLPHILPEVAALKDVPQSPEHHPEGDVFVHTMLLLEKLPEKTHPLTALAGLLHDIGKPPTREWNGTRWSFNHHASVGAEIAALILERLRFSNMEREQVLALIANHMRFIQAKAMRPATLKRFLRLDHFEEHLILHAADCAASHGSTENLDYCREKLQTFSEEELRPPRLISGGDFLSKGFRGGPQLGRALTLLEDWQLEGRFKTKEEGLALLQEAWKTTEKSPDETGKHPGEPCPEK